MSISDTLRFLYNPNVKISVVSVGVEVTGAMQVWLPVELNEC